MNLIHQAPQRGTHLNQRIRQLPKFVLGKERAGFLAKISICQLAAKSQHDINGLDNQFRNIEANHCQQQQRRRLNSDNQLLDEGKFHIVGCVDFVRFLGVILCQVD